MHVQPSHVPHRYSVYFKIIQVEFIHASASFDFHSNSLFPTVLYLTSATAVITKKQKHKTLSAENVLEALEEVEFENFVEPLRHELDTFRRANKEKKATKSNGIKSTTATSVEHEDPTNDDMEE